MDNTIDNPHRELRWMKLDNAAKIFPAARRKNWSNVFRISACFDSEIDRNVLKSALAVTVKRFPSVAVRLRTGMFWYYLEEVPVPPELTEEKSHPLSRMSDDEIYSCALRVIVYKNRIALEFFHAVTDGTGGLVFAKSLFAEYTSRRYHVYVPNTNGIVDRYEEPTASETEDSFLKYSGSVRASRSEKTAYRIHGRREKDGYKTNTTFMLKSADVYAFAKRYGVTVTAFLTAVLMKAVLNLQNDKIKLKRRQKPVKIHIPVNLRKLFPSQTMRNFVLCASPEADPRLGEYSFEDLCKLVRSAMEQQITAQQMAAKMAANVNSEKSLFVRILPLFLKNIIMKAIFDIFGERKACFSLSNLGVVELPESMRNHIVRMDFILGVQANAPYNCGVLTYGDTLYMNFIRDIREPLLEKYTADVLLALGIHVKAESNSRERH